VTCALFNGKLATEYMSSVVGMRIMVAERPVFTLLIHAEAVLRYFYIDAIGAVVVVFL
jgi:hypothetical protein